MEHVFEGLPFRPADILLPRDCEYSKWSVVACDQYTSQPEYWQRVEERVGRAPSALRLILPESCLEGPSVETDIMEINNTMTRYLREGRFKLYQDAIFYVERTLHSGKVRRGLVGMVDLEAYDYEPGSATLVRATEGTVTARIPPRVKVRKNAPIELPHIMLLADDGGRTVIEPLAARTGEMEELYDFELMEDGGHLKGWALTSEQKEQVGRALAALKDPEGFRKRYGLDDHASVMLLAVGDGNHSLATAKECYERQKRYTPPEQWDSLPSRYALAELVNLYDDSLEFEPIHRLLFGVDSGALLSDLVAEFPGAALAPWGSEGGDGMWSLPYIAREGRGTVLVPRGGDALLVGKLQPFLDRYCISHGCGIDYVHGAGAAEELGSRPGNLALLLPAMDKESLFPGVIRGGALPRKTFSMGEANDKRFYLEARKIRD